MRHFVLCAFALCILSFQASAQSYPTKQIQMVIPFPAGGGTDTIARIIAQKLEQRMGQPVIAENRPGATGNVGTEVVVNSEPDGYTLLVNITALGMYPLVFDKLPFDPIKELAIIGTIVETPTVLVVPRTSSAKTLTDFIEQAKREPDPLTYGSGGTGSPPHLAAMQFGRQVGINIEHVNYRGTMPAANDVVGEHIDFGSFSLSGVLGLINGEQLHPLVVLSANRSALLPDLPTAAESGFPGIDSRLRFILAAPAGTPESVIAKLNSELNWALDQPDVRERALNAGLEPIQSSSEEAAAMLVAERDFWSPLLRDNGIKLD